MSYYKRTQEIKNFLNQDAERCEELASLLREYADHQTNYEHEFIAIKKKVKSAVIDLCKEILNYA